MLLPSEAVQNWFFPLLSLFSLFQPGDKSKTKLAVMACFQAIRRVVSLLMDAYEKADFKSHLGQGNERKGLSVEEIFAPWLWHNISVIKYVKLSLVAHRCSEIGISWPLALNRFALSSVDLLIRPFQLQSLLDSSTRLKRFVRNNVN